MIVDPPTWLPFAADAFVHLLEHREPIRQALAASEADLLREGLPAPLGLAGAAVEGYVPLFVRPDPTGPRRRLHDLGGGRLVRPDGSVESVGDLVARIRRDPREASGDVVGRVFVQNRLLPVLAFLGGPSELAYQVPIRAAHEAAGVSFPLALPRPSATWADPKARRAAQAFGLSVADVLVGGPREAVPHAIGPTPDVEEALQAVRDEVLADPPRALGAWRDQSGDGPEALRRAWRAVQEAWDRAAALVPAAFARDRGVDAARWSRLQALLFPRGRAQERGLSALSLVARHGEEAFRRGLSLLDPLVAEPRLLHLA